MGHQELRCRWYEKTDISFGVGGFVGWGGGMVEGKVYKELNVGNSSGCEIVNMFPGNLYGCRMFCFNCVDGVFC